jgi:hypothetical protein
MGEHHLHGLGVSFDELVQRTLTLLDYLVKIIYRGYLLEITSIVGTSAFPSTPCAYPTLFTEHRGRLEFSEVRIAAVQHLWLCQPSPLQLSHS